MYRSAVKVTQLQGCVRATCLTFAISIGVQPRVRKVQQTVCPFQNFPKPIPTRVTRSNFRLASQTKRNARRCSCSFLYEICINPRNRTLLSLSLLLTLDQFVASWITMLISIQDPDTVPDTRTLYSIEGGENSEQWRVSRANLRGNYPWIWDTYFHCEETRTKKKQNGERNGGCQNVTSPCLSIRQSKRNHFAKFYALSGVRWHRSQVEKGGSGQTRSSARPCNARLHRNTRVFPICCANFACWNNETLQDFWYTIYKRHRYESLETANVKRFEEIQRSLRVYSKLPLYTEFRHRSSC